MNCFGGDEVSSAASMFEPSALGGAFGGVIVPLAASLLEGTDGAGSVPAPADCRPTSTTRVAVSSSPPVGAPLGSSDASGWDGDPMTGSNPSGACHTRAVERGRARSRAVEALARAHRGFTKAHQGLIRGSSGLIRAHQGSSGAHQGSSGAHQGASGARQSSWRARRGLVGGNPGSSGSIEASRTFLAFARARAWA